MTFHLPPKSKVFPNEGDTIVVAEMWGIADTSAGGRSVEALKWEKHLKTFTTTQRLFNFRIKRKSLF